MFESRTPTETVAFQPNYKGEPKREVESRFVLGTNAEGSTVRVTLTSSHYKERKQYVSRLTWETTRTVDRHPSDGPGVVSVTSWSSDHRSVLVLADNAERYSKKALASFHDDALANLADHFAVESVQAVFEQAFATVSEAVPA